MKQYRITAAAFAPPEPTIPDAYIDPAMLNPNYTPKEKPDNAGFPEIDELRRQALATFRSTPK